MTEVGGRTYGGETAEERVRRRRAALIDAAIVVVAEHGWRQLTVERVCDAAGLIRRYFYESFHDVDALGRAVVDTGTQRLLARLTRHDLTAPPAELIHTVIDTTVCFAAENPQLMRVLFGELASSGTATEHRQTAIRSIIAALAADARAAHRADDPLLDLTASLLVNGSVHTLLDWLDGTVAMDRDQFVDDLAQMWLVISDGAINRIAAKPPAGGSSGPIAGPETHQ